MNTLKPLWRPALGLLTAWLASSALAQTDAGEAAPANPYGLAALWAQGDWVAKGTLLILVGMSMGSWYVIFTKLVEQLRLGQQARAAQEKAALEAANRERHRVSDRPVYTPPSGGTAARSGDNRSTEQRLRDDAFWDNYQRCGFGKC